MAALAIVICILVVSTMIVAVVLYTKGLEKKIKRLQDSIKEPPPVAKNAVSRDDINKVFAEMQASNQKAFDDFGKSMAALTPTPTRSAGGGGGGGSSGGGTETRSLKDDLERYNTTLTNKIVEQERALKNSILSYTTSMVQQEQLINAMRSVNSQQDAAINAIKSGNTQQEQILSRINTIQDVNVRQEAVINRLIGVQQEAPKQVQPDDIAKRANLMAIAYYNAMRDKTPGQKLQWDLLLKHMYICGFIDTIYREPHMLAETYMNLMGVLPYQNKTRVIDIVTYLTEFLSKYAPYANNPRGLKVFELEIERGNGSTFPSLTTTYGALDPQTEFYPPATPDLPNPQLGINRGSPDLYAAIITQNQQAKTMLADAIAAGNPVS